MFSYEKHPNGPRIRIAGQRIHHGAVGVTLMASGNLILRMIGTILIIHDRHDWKVWFQPGAQMAD